MSDKLILKELCRYRRGTFADIIYRNALLHADDEAFVCDTRRITFAQFNARVNSLIHGLCSLKVKKGDVLGILSWNCLEYPDVYGAAMKGGFIASPFNPRLQTDELEYLINYSEANTLFFDPAFASTIDGLRSRLSRVRNYISLGDTIADMVSHQQLLAGYLIE